MEEAGYSWDAQISFDHAIIRYFNRFERMRLEKEEVKLDPIERRNKKHEPTKFVPKYSDEYLKAVLDGINPLDETLIDRPEDEPVTQEMWDAIPDFGDEEQ